MIKTILVPLDGSPFAEQGLAAACRVALDTGATLFLMRSVLYYGLMRENEGIEREALREARTYLEQTRDRLVGEGYTVEIEVLPSDPVQAILFASEIHTADLICMSTHGATGLRHVVLGSVAEAVLRRSRKPTLLVRTLTDPDLTRAKPLQQILVPLDGTPFSEAALRFLATQNLGHRARITLLRTVTPTNVTTTTLLAGDALMQMYKQAEQDTDDRRIEAEEYVAAVGLRELKDFSWRPLVTLGYPADDIRTVADDQSTDLIVMTTHGRHGFDRMLHGSVGRSLIHHARIPLLLLPAPVVEPSPRQENHSSPERQATPV